MKPVAVHQVLVGASGADAITGMARTLRTALRQRGSSEIYAHFIDASAQRDVLPLEHLPAGGRHDIVVYHASYGSPHVTRALLRRRERIVLIYHNITPSRFFIDHQPEFAVGLEWGRHELNLLRNRVILSVADSRFNAEDLHQLGFDDVHVVPAGVHPSRLHAVAPVASLAREIHGRFPNGYVLAVSQLLPHKRFETLLQAMHLLEWVHGSQLGLVIAGGARMPQYDQALRRHASQLRLRHLWFTGSLDDSQLATMFRMARLFASTSAHEGLALPPLEAMSFCVPVVVRAAGAIADTIGTAGVVLPEQCGPSLFCEALHEVDRNEALRSLLIQRGVARVNMVENSDPARAFLQLLDQVA